jgi:hypothetical protein
MRDRLFPVVEQLSSYQGSIFLVYATNREVSDQDLTARLEEHLDKFGCRGVTDR